MTSGIKQELMEHKVFFGNIQVRCMSINELVTNDLNINMQYSEQEKKRQKVISCLLYTSDAADD